MKLKTKIIWITCLAAFIISLTGYAVIWVLTRRSFLNEAEIKGYQNAHSVVSDLEQLVNKKGTRNLDDRVLEYFFKSQGDDYNLCFRTTFPDNNKYEIYNHTIFGTDTLDALNYQSREGFQSSFAYMKYEGKHYIVYIRSIAPDISVYRIEDITYVWEKLEWLTVCMSAITAGVMIISVIILSIILKRVLRPLQKLNDSAKAMAEGLYDKRVDIVSRDEIGQLGENFNRMADAIEMRTHNLEESELKKTLLMGNLSHELKTPMTAISGYAKTLLTVKLSDADREEALLYINEACGRLERLSKKMMKLLELEGNAELDFKEVSAAKLFDSAAKSCEGLLREKNMTLEFEEQGESFYADEDLMTDVLINLIDNAVKASEPGSRVILSAGTNYICVQDFGTGIPEEEKEKILEPFYMIDKSRSRKNGGAGLGLALTALIIKQHNARLKIESEVGKGTSMILQFV